MINYLMLVGLVGLAIMGIDLSNQHHLTLTNVTGAVLALFLVFGSLRRIAVKLQARRSRKAH